MDTIGHNSHGRVTMESPVKTLSRVFEVREVEVLKVPPTGDVVA